MHKKFSKFFSYFYLIAFILPLLMNNYIDPDNIFDSTVTDFIPASDERKIKLYHLKNNKNRYNSVLIGSSRSSYIDVSALPNYKMFNLSVSGISIDEYLPYLKFFEQFHGKPKLIILSLDFHSTNLNYNSNVDPNIMICDTNSVLKQKLDYAKLKKLQLSFLLLTKSQKNIGDYYTRSMVKKRYNQEKPLDNNSIMQTIDYYKKDCLKSYKYREDFYPALLKIKNAFPYSKIIVIICPIHQSLIDFQKKTSGDYFSKKWIADISSIFGGFIDFNNDVELTNNKNNFFDAAHFYPFVGEKIINFIQKKVL